MDANPFSIICGRSESAGSNDPFDFALIGRAWAIADVTVTEWPVHSIRMERTVRHTQKQEICTVDISVRAAKFGLTLELRPARRACTSPHPGPGPWRRAPTGSLRSWRSPKLLVAPRKRPDGCSALGLPSKKQPRKTNLSPFWIDNEIANSLQ